MISGITLKVSTIVVCFFAVFVTFAVAEEVGELGIYFCIRPLERFEPPGGYERLGVQNCDLQSDDVVDTIYMDNKWGEKLGHCFLVLARYLGICDASDGSGRQLKILERVSAFGFGGTGSSGKSGEVFPESEKILQGKMPISGMRLFSKDDISSEDRSFDSEIEDIWKENVNIMNREVSKGYSHIFHNCCTVALEGVCFIINNINIGGRKAKRIRYNDVLSFLGNINFRFGICACSGHCRQIPTAAPRPGPRIVENYNGTWIVETFERLEIW